MNPNRVRIFGGKSRFVRRLGASPDDSTAYRAFAG